MRRAQLAIILLVVFTASSSLQAQGTRLASDFEIETVRRQIAGQRDPQAQIAAWLNLGDLLMNRSHSREAREAYQTAFELASTARVDARHASDMTRYGRSTSYAALAQARLGSRGAAFDLFEESLRYLGDSPVSWNLYASGLLVLGQFEPSAAAARNAVAIAQRSGGESASAQLDLSVYRYTLASALAGTSAGRAEAVTELEAIIATLESSRFDRIRRQVTAQESFEIFSTTSSNPAAYLSLLLRSRLKLSSLYEERGESGRAAEIYREVLRQRTDQPQALAALARIAGDLKERQHYFAEAFDANPFAPSLIRSYEEALPAVALADRSLRTGARVREAIEHLHAGRAAAARQVLDGLLHDFPGNESLLALAARSESMAGNQREAARLLESVRTSAARQLASKDASAGTLRQELASLSDEPAVVQIASDRFVELRLLLGRSDLTAAERQALDRTLFSSAVTLLDAIVADGSTTASGALAGSTLLDFGAPISFRGGFEAGETHQLEFRLIGLRHESEDALLVEPVRVVRR
jgi:tetratricopeptide (TPR) repeat protein